MDSLEQIKVSLQNNPNLTDEIKERFLKLIIVLNKKMPDVNLNVLIEKLKTIEIKKMSKFEKKGTYYYDVHNNKMFFSSKLSGNYDIDNFLMQGILQMSTNNSKFTGFDSDERLYALNLAYTEILATYLVGNEGFSDMEEEMLVANLIGGIVGKETLYNSYFSNNGMPIIKAIQDAEVGLL